MKSLSKRVCAAAIFFLPQLHNTYLAWCLWVRKTGYCYLCVNCTSILTTKLPWLSKICTSPVAMPKSRILLSGDHATWASWYPFSSFTQSRFPTKTKQKAFIPLHMFVLVSANVGTKKSLIGLFYHLWFYYCNQCDLPSTDPRMITPSS